MRLVTYNNDNEFKFFYMCIAKMFYLTGTAWDEVLKLKTLNYLGLNTVKVNSSRVLFSDRNSSG